MLILSVLEAALVEPNGTNRRTTRTIVVDLMSLGGTIPCETNGTACMRKLARVYWQSKQFLNKGQMQLLICE